MAYRDDDNGHRETVVCGRCGVSEVGRLHTYDQCIVNLRDLLRHYRDGVRGVGRGVTDTEQAFIEGLR